MSLAWQTSEVLGGVTHDPVQSSAPVRLRFFLLRRFFTSHMRFCSAALADPTAEPRRLLRYPIASNLRKGTSERGQ